MTGTEAESNQQELVQPRNESHHEDAKDRKHHTEQTESRHLINSVILRSQANLNHSCQMDPIDLEIEIPEALDDEGHLWVTGLKNITHISTSIGLGPLSNTKGVDESSESVLR